MREGLLLIQGLADATLAHDEAWHFLLLGKYLERADNVARLLSMQSHLLTIGSAAGHGDDTVRWLAVLRSAAPPKAYARYYSLRVEPPRVIEFLLLNPLFPAVGAVQSGSRLECAAGDRQHVWRTAGHQLATPSTDAGPPESAPGARVDRRSA